MLALAEFGKVLGGDRSGKAELRGQPALPFAGNDAALRPIVLLLGGEFLLVVALRLALRKAAWKWSACRSTPIDVRQIEPHAQGTEDYPASLPALPGEACLARSDRPSVAHRNQGSSLRAQ
jgi:hypothetical protein